MPKGRNSFLPNTLAAVKARFDKPRRKSNRHLIEKEAQKLSVGLGGCILREDIFPRYWETRAKSKILRHFWPGNLARQMPYTTRRQLAAKPLLATRGVVATGAFRNQP
jgi:hypothetical protein